MKWRLSLSTRRMQATLCGSSTISGLNSVPGVNIALPLSSADRSGHGFEPAYLDKTRAAYGKTRSLIEQSLDVLAQSIQGNTP